MVETTKTLQERTVKAYGWTRSSRRYDEWQHVCGWLRDQKALFGDSNSGVDFICPECYDTGARIIGAHMPSNAGLVLSARERREACRDIQALALRKLKDNNQL